jgi:hypothetical protein
VLETDTEAAEKLKLTPALLQVVIARLKSLALPDDDDPSTLRSSFRGRVPSWDEEMGGSRNDRDTSTNTFRTDNLGSVIEEETVMQSDRTVRRRGGRGTTPNLERRKSTIKFTLEASEEGLDKEETSKKWLETANSIEVSFTMFLMALQPILVGRILGKTPNRANETRNKLSTSFAEYLN